MVKLHKCHINEQTWMDERMDGLMKGRIYEWTKGYLEGKMDTWLK